MAGTESRKASARVGAAVAGAIATLGLTGCAQETVEQWGRWGLPESASDRAPYIGNLWSGAWIASMIIGVFVWGLIGWAVFRYRRRHDAELPRQTRYNLPLEILYTLVPFLIIGVLFFFTVQAQNGVRATETEPDHTINVLGQKWSWTFNYMEAGNTAVGEDVHSIGTLEQIPELYLPVGESVRFNLNSADVIHSFWIPDFYFKLDVIPGKQNSFDVTPTREGRYLGKCAELCGTYHAAMVFYVNVVSEDEYNAHLRGLAELGQTGEIRGPSFPSMGAGVPEQEG